MEVEGSIPKGEFGPLFELYSAIRLLINCSIAMAEVGGLSN
jgi:hypothetical protein